MAFEAEQLGSWRGVMVVNGLMGLGRSVWENTNKAIYADFFQGSPQTITTTTAAAAALKSRTNSSWRG